MTIIHFTIQAVMGVFLLELKRGDRVAAEKVFLYIPLCPIEYNYIPLGIVSHCVPMCPIVYCCVSLCTMVYYCLPSSPSHSTELYQVHHQKISQVFHEWGNYMQGPQTSAVRDIIQVAKKYFWGPNKY